MKRSLTFSFLGLIAIAPLTVAGPVDMSKEIQQAPIPQPFSWEGLYIGINAGGTFGTSHANDTRSYLDPHPRNGNERSESWDYDTSGFTGGLQAGYNWQRRWLVLGLESDAGYLNVDGSGSHSRVLEARSSTESVFYSSLRGRAGIACGRWLIYATGGGIVLHYNVSIDDDDNDAHVSHWAFRPGWTAGGGFEYAWNDRWSLKAEYLYFETENGSVDLRQRNGSDDQGHFFFDHYSYGHIVRAGVNYHFGGPPAPQPPTTGYDKSGKTVMEPAPIATEFTWTGPYVGLHFGWGLGGLTWNDEKPETDEHIVKDYQHGVFGGLQSGLNYQIGLLVVGAEGQFSGTDIDKETKGFEPHGADFGHGKVETNIDWMASVAARIGATCPHILDGRLLAYGKIGMSDAHIEYLGDTQEIGPPVFREGKHFGPSAEGRFAPLVGGGLEYAFSDHWTAKVEYSYANYGTKIIRGPYDEGITGQFSAHNDEQYETKFRLHLIEAGVNFKF